MLAVVAHSDVVDDMWAVGRCALAGFTFITT